MSSNRLERALLALQVDGRAGVAPYVTAGDGGLETTKAILLALEEGGAACVELGVPFSDPIADGPILQAAAQRALDAGTNLRGILQMVTELRSAGCELPIALFSYTNPLYAMGWDNAGRASRDAGVDGWLVPDMIPSQARAMRKSADANDIACIFFAAPTSSPERIAAAAEASRGFLYAIGRVGVTGQDTQLGPSTLEFLSKLRNSCSLPIGVGFGLRDPQQIAAVTKHAELAIVGSAFVARISKAYDRNQSANDAAREAALYLKELQQGLRP
jgi:tryptophan synthase alpha chain